MDCRIVSCRAAASVVVVAVLASVAACGSQGTGVGAQSVKGSSMPAAASSASGTSSPSAAGTSAQAAEAVQQALAAYRGAFAAWVSVASVASKSDYQSPVLAEHMSGQALSSVTGQVFIDTSTDGAVSRGAPVLHPTVGELVPADSPAQVVVNDCVDTSSWLLYTPDGRPYDDIPGGHDKTQALMVLADGVWKLDQLYMQDPGTC
ncbi:MAG TPA: hypothetical protein VGX23_18790 [Actinocrinis sp.]|nr:hypothetical protein [Actinocrinis sp.]